MSKAFFKRYTHDLTSDELGKLFTRETPEAYRFFAQGINTAELEGLPWYKKAIKYAQGFFLAFTMRLSPARRLMYGVSLGLVGHRPDRAVPRLRPDARADSHRAVLRPHSRARRRCSPTARCGCSAGFLLMNLLVLLEVADRLSLKRDLEVAREIQQAMLPDGTLVGSGRRGVRPDQARQHRRRRLLRHPAAARWHRARRARRRRRQGQPGGAADGAVAGHPAHAGRRRPAAACAGQAPQPAGGPARAGVALHHACSSRRTRPSTGRLEFVNAGQTPPLLRRQNGAIERLMSGGIALGMFEGSDVRGRRGAARIPVTRW